MGKKDKIIITRPDDFAVVEEALSAALDDLDHANARVEAFLKEQAQSETGTQPVVEASPLPCPSDSRPGTRSEG